MKKLLQLLVLFLSLQTLNAQTCFFGNYPPVNTLTLGFTNGAWIAHKYTLASTATLTGLGMNLTTANGATYRMAMYTDNANQPGNLVSLSNTGTMVAGQNFVLVPTPTVIPAGTYWIAALFNSSGTALTTVANANGYVFLPGNINTAPSNNTTWNAGQNYDLDYWAMINNPVISVAGTTAVCQNSSTTLTASGAASYSWSTGQTGASVTVTPLAAMTITCYGISLQGCVAGTLVNITTLTSPTISVTGSATICPGNSATLSATGNGTITWGSLTSPTIVVTPTTNLVLPAICTNSNGCTATESATVNLLAAPSLSISSSKAEICAGESVTITVAGASTYQWNNSATSTTLLINPALTTSYSVTGTGNNSCTATAAFTQSVAACLGINHQQQQIALCPNPAGDYLQVEGFSSGMLHIFDVSGRTVKTIELAEQTGKVDVSGLPAGFYSIRLSNTSQILHANFIKQ